MDPTRLQQPGATPTTRLVARGRGRRMMNVAHPDTTWPRVALRDFTNMSTNTTSPRVASLDSSSTTWPHVALRDSTSTTSPHVASRDSTTTTWPLETTTSTAWLPSASSTASSSWNVIAPSLPTARLRTRAARLPPGEREVVRSKKKQTELCFWYSSTGRCPYARDCVYAHGFNALRDRIEHPRYKSRPCRNYHLLGTCPYGNKCQFFHEQQERVQNGSRTQVNGSLESRDGSLESGGDSTRDEDGELGEEIARVQRELEGII